MWGFDGLWYCTVSPRLLSLEIAPRTSDPVSGSESKRKVKAKPAIALSRARSCIRTEAGRQTRTAKSALSFPDSERATVDTLTRTGGRMKDGYLQSSTVTSSKLGTSKYVNKRSSSSSHF